MELMELINKENRTPEEIKEHFGKLSDHIVLKTSKDTMNDIIVYNSFELIYQERINSDENPVAEELMFYILYLRGFYGMELDEITLLIEGYGTVNFLMTVKNLCDSLNTQKFFRELYNLYISNITSTSFIIKEALDAVINGVANFVEGLDEERVSQLVSDATKKLEELRTNL